MPARAGHAPATRSSCASASILVPPLGLAYSVSFNVGDIYEGRDWHVLYVFN